MFIPTWEFWIWGPISYGFEAQLSPNSASKKKVIIWGSPDCLRRILFWERKKNSQYYFLISLEASICDLCSGHKILWSMNMWEISPFMNPAQISILWPFWSFIRDLAPTIFSFSYSVLIVYITVSTNCTKVVERVKTIIFSMLPLISYDVLQSIIA